MRKSKRVLAILLIVSVLISCVVGFYSGAEEEPFKYHTHFMQEHFGNIQTQSHWNNANLYPANDIGSCPYVSMALLLSFYDAYWNDDFVPSGYETKGTISLLSGIIGDETHFTLENSEWDKYAAANGIDLSNISDANINTAQQVYSDFIDAHWDKYFQLYLIHLAKEQGFHDGELVYELTGDEMVDFLEFYLYNICGFTSNQITVNRMRENLTTTNEDLFNAAKAHIQEGFPVIYGGYEADIGNIKLLSSIGDSFSGHALLAYDLTDDENDIILSPCWNSEPTETFYTTDYRYLSDIIWLEINEDAFPHVCSDSYDSTVGLEHYCICDIYYDHPAHTHKIDEVTPVYHAYDSTTHTFTCFWDGEIVTTSHKFAYQSISNAYHTYECDCGYTNVANHNMVRTSPRYSVCANCGYTRDHHQGGNEMIPWKDDTDLETE